MNIPSKIKTFLHWMLGLAILTLFFQYGATEYAQNNPYFWCHPFASIVDGLRWEYQKFAPFAFAILSAIPLWGVGYFIERLQEKFGDDVKVEQSDIVATMAGGPSAVVLFMIFDKSTVLFIGSGVWIVLNIIYVVLLYRALKRKNL